MVEFKITSLLLEKPVKWDDLNRINNSDIKDVLSQLILYKISAFAHSILTSLHNSNYEKNNNLNFLFLSLPIEKMSEKEYSQARTVELLDLTTKLTTPPNPAFKMIKTQKYFSQKGIVEGVETQILFNPYLLSLAISEIYFRLSNDRRIHQWCSEGHIRRESIEKVVKIIEDKYSYRFVELLSIAEEFFIRIYDSDNETKLKLYSELTGLNGDLIHSYIGWTFEFYEDELIPTIQSQLGKLVYS